jgi:hypothetical protein
MKMKKWSITKQFSKKKEQNNDRTDVDKTDMLTALATFTDQDYSDYIYNDFCTPEHMEEKTDELKTLMDNQRSLSLIRANAHYHIDNCDSLETSSLFRFAGGSALIGAATSWILSQWASIGELISSIQTETDTLSKLESILESINNFYSFTLALLILILLITSMFYVAKVIKFSKIRFAMLAGKRILNLIDELKEQE